MNVCRDKAEQLVRVALDKEFHRQFDGFVFLNRQLEGFGIQRKGDPINKGVEVEFPVFVNEANGLRRSVEKFRITVERIIGREELGKERDDEKHAEEDRADQCQTMPFELPPD